MINHLKLHRSAFSSSRCDFGFLFLTFCLIHELVWNIIKQKIKNKNPKSQRELENAVDEALNGLSLNVIQACIKKTQKIYQHFVSSY